MRTLTLAPLAALLLLAFHAQAEPLPERTHQTEEEDQVAVISFPGDESSAHQHSGMRTGAVCFCRLSTCRSQERTLGICRYRGLVYRFCCR